MEKEKEENAPWKPKPVEQEGMPPQYQALRPHAKDREDKNPKEQQKHVARILAEHPPKNAEKEQK
jgi:hypothetical protein